jgi:glutamine synthetase
MSSLRFSALQEVRYRKPVYHEEKFDKTSGYFGVNVFNKSSMQQYLSKEAYNHVQEAIEKGIRIDRKIAEQIASGMKSWAVDRGATHYTHWFHPLNGANAEKHDAFFEPGENDSVFENFGGDKLVQQEPDASSFPSGGIRNTFEARGYTAWDPSSPAFIVGKTLCIPTIFVSYTGEALDYKTPLLKSLHELDKAATEVCQYFDRNVEKVIATLGWEQEYFLIDTALYSARPDLSLTKRTMMGHSSAKDQQLADHYFGSIPERVAAYMQDLEVEALKLGIPIKTKHNEVAPNQYECAPVFEEANLAVDHNQLLMDLMDRVARHHNFRVLFHEKPYKGVNGSGKHNNWSMMTNNGKNLLSPGNTPKRNMLFLTFLINTLKAVKENADLLRASIASSGNQHRLGANEAPPAIISAFIGQKLTSVLNEIEAKVSDKKMSPDEKTELKLDIGKIPEILLDNTDRNRTSPFAFTGNRFEFRAVGSNANCSSPMIALNTSMANQLREFKKEVDKLIAKKVKKDEAIFQVLRKYIIDTKAIRFEGDGYSEEWVEEAEKRGLTNIKDVPEAFSHFVSEKTLDLFEKNNILNRKESEARYFIRLERYLMKMQIEARVLGDLAINHIIPTAIKYQNTLIDNVRGIKEVCCENDFENVAGMQLDGIKTISKHINGIKDKVTKMREIKEEVNNISDIPLKASRYSKEIFPFFDDIRYHIDELELLVDDELWPMPKYREMLFTR